MGEQNLSEAIHALAITVDQLGLLAKDAADWGGVNEELAREIERITGELEDLRQAIRSRVSTPGPPPLPPAVTVPKPYAVRSVVPFPSAAVYRVDVPWPSGRGRYDEAWVPAGLADQVDVVAYLDTDDQSKIDATLDALENLADVLGYSEVRVIKQEGGSFWRRASAKAKEGFLSEEVQDRLAKIERAVDLAAIAVKQADVDERTANAVNGLIASLDGIPRACVRVGSILLVKYEQDGQPTILSRSLSAVEMRALEKYPGIQKDPEATLQLLGRVLMRGEHELDDDPGGDVQ
jgi:hypothetical protein